jgi:flagellar biosynthesis/type III secretory pathway protein FliH
LPDTVPAAEVFSFAALEPPIDAESAASVAAHLHTLEDEARERGRREGMREGLAAAGDRIAPAVDALAAAAAGVLALREELIDGGERRAVELALAIAAKVVGTTVAVSPGAVLEVVAGALRRTTERERLVIEVAPDDLAIVREAVDGLAAQLGGIGRLEVVAERRIGRGGCIVRTGEGEIDATLDRQLERVGELVAQALRAPARADA